MRHKLAGDSPVLLPKGTSFFVNGQRVVVFVPLEVLEQVSLLLDPPLEATSVPTRKAHGPPLPSASCRAPEP